MLSACDRAPRTAAKKCSAHTSGHAAKNTNLMQKSNPRRVASCDPRGRERTCERDTHKSQESNILRLAMRGRTNRERNTAAARVQASSHRVHAIQNMWARAHQHRWCRTAESIFATFGARQMVRIPVPHPIPGGRNSLVDTRHFTLINCRRRLHECRPPHQRPTLPSQPERDGGEAG